MKIINKFWSEEQRKDVVEFVAASAATLPTTDIACGSVAFCEDGIYVLFESGWKKIN